MKYINSKGEESLVQRVVILDYKSFKYFKNFIFKKFIEAKFIFSVHQFQSHRLLFALKIESATSQKITTL
jgi:hypothetical protein